MAETFLEEFYHREAFGIITTHYSNLKILANELPFASNANMLFDEKSLEPLYKLILGQAGSSFTFEVAQKNGIEWASTAPPSLGEMNIFGDDKAKESDPNDVKAGSLSLITKPTGDDGTGAPTAIQIVPRLVDAAGNPVSFTGAGLEATLEVYFELSTS